MDKRNDLSGEIDMESEDYVFISYKSDDREEIRKYVKQFEEWGVKYWWDQHISGEWGKDIETALTNAKVVVVFLTEKCMASTGVFEECQRANTMGKLIPVRLDNSQFNYHFSSLIAFLNYVDLSNEGSNQYNAEKKRLLYRLQCQFGTNSRSIESNDKEVNTTEDFCEWIKDKKKFRYLPYVIALSVFENRNHDLVQIYATLLERKIIDNGFDSDYFADSKFISKTQKLCDIKAELLSYESKLLPHPIDYVKFKDQEFRKNFLEFTWGELDQVKGPLIEWFKDIIQINDEALELVASALALIAHKHFNSVYFVFVKPWLSGDNERQILCADLALSLMTADEKIRTFVRETLLDFTDDVVSQNEDEAKSVVSQNEDEAKSNATTELMDKVTTANSKVGTASSNVPFDNEKGSVAVRLACGYTGMSMPDVSIQILKKLDEMLIDKELEVRDKNKLIMQLARGVKLLTKRAGRELYALAVLKIFIRNLGERVSPPDSERMSYLPEYIGLEIMINTSVTSTINGKPSLTDIVGADSVDSGLMTALAKLFDNALSSENKMLKDMAKKTIGMWCAEVKSKKNEPDKLKTLESLVRKISQFSKTQDDKDRIQHMVEGIINI